MTDDLRQLDGVEKAWLDLDAAEQAGVYRSTPIDATALLNRPVAVRRPAAVRLAMRLLPVAAAVALAVGAWQWSIQPGATSPDQPHVNINGLASADTGGCGGAFLGCFTGPRDGVPTDCLAHDYDSDGDVDLFDFSAFQQTDCAGPAESH